MSTSKSNKNRICRQSSEIELKTIVNDNTVSLLDAEKAAIKSDEQNNVNCEQSNGINIKFQDIIYRARRNFIWDRSTKTILDGINGEFRAGELTSIMGPSGAGKTTLLDILTGYITNLASGTITVNGRCRDLKRFRCQSAYIMQECQLQVHLTIWEAMFFSINLKIGSQLKRNEKKERIKRILDTIGLHENPHRLTGDLSGGQRKRLAIALELVDNPPFMAFDEPTSGLDSSTSNQILLLLKQLAQQGRTILCSIHQPPPSAFDLFDHLYMMASGKCIYAGTTGMLIPFLAEFELICPLTYDPFDYLMEVATDNYGQHNVHLIEKIRNGLNDSYRINPCGSAHQSTFEIKPSDNMDSEQQQLVSEMGRYERNGVFATSFMCQWYLLTLRVIRCYSRDRTLTLMRPVIHFCIALMIGTLYYNIGDDASMMFNNFRYAFMTLMFLMYTAFCSMAVLFPLEMPIVAREHFNRWYSEKAYYFALTFTDFPLQFLCVLIFVLITYFMTGQPFELFRLAFVLIITFVLTLISQGIGMIIGAVCGLTAGAILGPFVIAPNFIFCGFFVHLSDASPYLHWLFHISYLRYAVEGCIDAMFGYNRPKLKCNEIYCHYQIPGKFIKVVDMQRNDFWSAFIILLVILIAIRFIAFLVIMWRLKRR